MFSLDVTKLLIAPAVVTVAVTACTAGAVDGGSANDGGATVDAGSATDGSPGDSGNPTGDGGSVAPPFKIGTGTVYHVAPGGSDGADGSAATPFKTINQFTNVAKAGDTAQIHAGRYREDVKDNPGFRGNERLITFAAQSSGVPGNPITVMAFPGDEGKVIVDGENVRNGMHGRGQDYWQVYGLRFENAFHNGIGQYSQAAVAIPNADDLAVGWRIENCYVRITGSVPLENGTAVAMGGTKDFIVRNNRIVATSTTFGVHGYGLINALVENNYIEGMNGIYWKDHHLSSLNPRTPVFESEIRFNDVRALLVGVRFSLRGSPNVEGGSNYVHHNTIYGAGEAALEATGDPAYGPSKTVRFEHNSVYAASPDAVAVSTVNYEDVRVYGNVLAGRQMALDLRAGPYTALTASDYNAFGTAMFFTDHYGTNNKMFSTLASWQALLGAQTSCVKFDRPDVHSILLPAGEQTFVDGPSGNLHLSPTSAARGKLPDGTDLGAYQTPAIIVGTLPTYSAGL
ncbi:MAG: hypothetical protein HOO96_40230 [Polyangiaceae bacterium]|nr:hypothetical protein [Polyangiaceae bacterium]